MNIVELEVDTDSYSQVVQTAEACTILLTSYLALHFI